MYVSSLKGKIDESRLDPMVNDLLKDALQNPNQGHIKIILNHTISQLVPMMESSEEACRKIFAGHHDWSPELQQHQATVAYLHLGNRYHQGRSVDWRAVRAKRTLVRPEYNFDFTALSKDKVRKLYNKAKRELKQFNGEESEESRIQLKEMLYQQRAEANNTSTEAEKKKDKNLETQQKIH